MVTKRPTPKKSPAPKRREPKKRASLDPTLTADLVALGRSIPDSELANLHSGREPKKRASDPTLWTDIVAMFASVPEKDWDSIPRDAARRFDELVEGEGR